MKKKLHNYSGKEKVAIFRGCIGFPPEKDFFLNVPFRSGPDIVAKRAALTFYGFVRQVY